MAAYCQINNHTKSSFYAHATFPAVHTHTLWHTAVTEPLGTVPFPDVPESFLPGNEVRTWIGTVKLIILLGVLQ